MIVKSSARTGGRALADHLTNPEENERISITGCRNVTSDNVHESIAEMVGMAEGWRGNKPLIHAHISPDQAMSEKDWSASWAAYEKEFGLEGRPYVEVEHLKEGRLPHRHRAYLRVDTETHTANDVWRSKMRDEKVSRLLEHQFGHKLTHGPHDFWVTKKLQEEGRTDVAQWLEGRPTDRAIEAGNATNWDDHQQAKRTGISKDSVRDDMAAAWQAGDSGSAVAAALETKGYVLARGDKRDVVLVDVAGGVHSPARLLKQAGIDARAKTIRERFADLSDLPTVAQAQEIQGQHRQALTERPAPTEARPTPEQISEKRAERAQEAAKKREERRAAWIAERKAEYAAAKESVLRAFNGEKANRREVGNYMWKAEQKRRAGEREAMKGKVSRRRKRIYSLFSRGLLRTLALAAHNFQTNREWAALKKQQAERWQQAKMAHPVPKWHEFVQHRAAAGDAQALLLARVRSTGRRVEQAQAMPQQIAQPAAPHRPQVQPQAPDPLAGFRARVAEAEAAGRRHDLDMAKAQLAVAQEYQSAGKDPRHHAAAILEDGKRRALFGEPERPKADAVRAMLAEAARAATAEPKRQAEPQRPAPAAVAVSDQDRRRGELEARQQVMLERGHAAKRATGRTSGYTDRNAGTWLALPDDLRKHIETVLKMPKERQEREWEKRRQELAERYTRDPKAAKRDRESVQQRGGFSR
jgi:hypothetical protein